jgi:integrase
MGGSGPASTQHSRRRVPAPGCLIPLRVAPLLLDRMRHSLWRRCVELNPSLVGSARARFSVCRTSLLYPIGRSAAGLLRPAFPSRPRPTAPSWAHRPSETPNAAGETLMVNAHWFPDAVRAAGITDFRWHDCRHTFASRLRQSGTPLGNIAELLGHKTLAMSRRYAHLSIANLHEAVSRIATGTTVAPEQIADAAKVAYLQ